MKVEKILAQTALDVRRRDRVEDFGYRDLSGASLDHLINFSQNDILDDIQRMYLKNPLASRIVKAKTNYTIGDGLLYNADEEVVQQVLDDYMWRNNWDIKLQMKANDLSINGEMLILPETSKNARYVTVKTVYPRRIEKRFLETPYDDEPSAFKLVNDDNEYVVVKWDEAENGYIGNIFYYYINKLSHNGFGLSDLFSSRDWLNLYDKSFYATMSRVGMLLSFVWDVTIDTKDDRILKKKQEQLQKQPPVPGSARFHNKLEEWKAIAPGLNGSDLDNIYRMFKGQCMAGEGTPEFIFGLGGNVNYATAKMMLEPYFKDIKARQKYWGYIFKTQFDYVIWNAIKAGTIPSGTNINYSVGFAPPSQAAIADYSKGLQAFANGIVTLESNGVIKPEDSFNIIKLLVSQFGVEMHSDDESTSTYKKTEKTAASLARILRKGIYAK